MVTLSTADAPKEDTNTNTVPLTKKAFASSWVMLSNPTTIPSKKITHTNVLAYTPPNPNPKSTANTSPIKKDQLPNKADLPLADEPAVFAFAIFNYHLLFLGIGILLGLKGFCLSKADFQSKG